MAKPSLARGMRDFTPEETASREFVFNIIRNSFKKYGFLQLETPVIENLSTLTDKYGEEGDKLLFKILNSGEYLKDISAEALEAKNYKELTPKITEKGLRYDLTVPLARYVAMYRNELTFPFKRYQIDKVWRADRPQKGRYREFYQCDADFIGIYSLMYDAECVLLYDDVLTQLNLPNFAVKINNRKILSGLAEEWGFADKFSSFVIAIDKWDKIGENGVVQELGGRGFAESQIYMLQQLFRLQGTNEDKINQISGWMQKSETGKKGIEELNEVLGYVIAAKLQRAEVVFDITLARGLDYYTSSIFELVLKDYPIGSIGGGGRYNDLTASFGVPDMPGVGCSFGAERIYDVMKDLKLFPANPTNPVKVLLTNFGGEEERYAFGKLQELRGQGIGAEMYPAGAKMGKQFQYAEKKGIPYVLIIGSEEVKNNTFSLKNLQTGEQVNVGWGELVERLEIE